MRVKLIKNSDIVGESHKFNRASLNEVLVMWDNGEIDSELINDLQVLINGKWEYMKVAFQKHDLITDNENTEFFVPKNEEEKVRGYRLTSRDIAVLSAEAHESPRF